MSAINKFLVDSDNERRLAHRAELKRKIAESSLKKLKLEELRAVVSKLNADSDQAAFEHEQAAAPIQAELDQLDQQHIDDTLAGQKASPGTFARRAELLDKLTELNRTLESRCEANRRAAAKVERDIHVASVDLAADATLESRLAELCSVEIRREKVLAELLVKSAAMAVAESDRVLGIYQANMRLLDDNVARGFSRDDEYRIHKAQMDDALWVAAQVRQRHSEALQAQRDVHRRAMAE
jgi:hypothetical protein